VWFTNSGTCIPYIPLGHRQPSFIGRVAAAGANITALFTYGQEGITAGPDGTLWFRRTGSVNRMTTAGRFYFRPIAVLITMHLAVGGGIVPGPDAALWFTDDGYIGRVTTAGVVTEYPAAVGTGIAAGSDGAIWFTGPAIGRITTTGTVTTFPQPQLGPDRFPLRPLGFSFAAGALDPLKRPLRWAC
jgi:streptogramin lyase